MDYGHFKTREFEVWANFNLKHTEAKVYNALLCFLDWKTGVCYPSNAKLAESTGLKSQSNISRAATGLVEKGLIKKWRRPPQESKGWGSNAYQILNYKTTKFQNTTSGKIVPPTKTPVRKVLSEKDIDKLIEGFLNDHK